MKNIGTNEASSTAGACTPTATTTSPITAASEYAGAVDASPITSASVKPIALAFRPCSDRPDSSSSPIARPYRGQAPSATARPATNPSIATISSITAGGTGWSVVTAITARSPGSSPS
jgi:hypothetical protein